ncbi:hypothetical protein [Massilia endophytica]|uniref:hypothetical protein n=1 Tax=Massilia endophytica TaxID=2899220 RepID=UPI001E3F0366|nr:hypothetical protein [Massilia endophytica]UGQ48732.1 hypothetical protein LSQ66_09805 [Massilia endophytica]
MKTALAKEFAKHFPDIDLGEDDLDALGISYFHVSTFDHWLSEPEADDCQYLNYSITLDAGALEQYFVGEQRFLDFYSTLAVDGVICNRSGPLRVFETATSELREIFVNSLREKRLMDVYFCGAGVRIFGRYDRTDLVIADGPQQLEALRTKVANFGLSVLE